MSHPPAFSLTPADLAIETGGGGFSVDELSALSRGAGRGWALDGLRISCELRGAELGGHCTYRAGSSSGEKAGASLRWRVTEGGGALTWGRRASSLPRGWLLPASRSLT